MSNKYVHLLLLFLLSVEKWEQIEYHQLYRMPSQIFSRQFSDVFQVICVCLQPFSLHSYVRMIEKWQRG